MDTPVPTDTDKSVSDFGHDSQWSFDALADERFSDNPDINPALVALYETYVISARDKRLADQLDRLLDGALLTQSVSPGKRFEGRALFVTGESGAGKSRSLAYLFSKRPMLAPKETPLGTMMPLVSVVAPSPCTLRQLAQSILETVGYVAGKDLKENVAWRIVKHQLRERRVLILHIDELQHALQSVAPQEHQKVLNTLKNIMQDDTWPMRLILSGLPDLKRMARKDPQIPFRSRFFSCDKLSIPHDVKFVRFLLKAILETRLGFDIKHIQSDEFYLRLCHAAENLTGRIVRITQGAAEEVIYSGRKVVEEADFAAAYALISGCDRDENVFLVRKWDQIDPSNGLDSDDPEIADDSRPRRKRRRK